MAARRVLVLYRGSLLTQGVEKLLCGRAGLVVAGVALDGEGALESVCSFHPDVVIVDSDDMYPEVTQNLLRDNPGVRVIYLRLVDAQAQLVSSRQITVNNVADLLQVLEGG